MGSGGVPFASVVREEGAVDVWGGGKGFDSGLDGAPTRILTLFEGDHVDI